MTALIDTCSLIAFVRYYLPFDKDCKLYNFIKEQIKDEHLLIIDKVYIECKRQSGGLVIDKMPFLNDKSYHTKTDILIPTRKFYNCIDNNFVNNSERKRLGDAEYQFLRNAFLNSADCALMAYSHNLQSSGDVILITEETGYNNDGKVFKKIPECCKSLGVQTMSLPQFLLYFSIIDLSIDVFSTTLFN